jgi:hypothetical protein
VSTLDCIRNHEIAIEKKPLVSKRLISHFYSRKVELREEKRMRL